MSEPDSPPRVRNARPVAFLPATALLAAVGIAMTVDVHEELALQTIFSSFVVGVCLALLSQALEQVSSVSRSIVQTTLAVRVSLLVAAVLLYLVFGCVFGCPG